AFRALGEAEGRAGGPDLPSKRFRLTLPGSDAGARHWFRAHGSGCAPKNHGFLKGGLQGIEVGDFGAIIARQVPVDGGLKVLWDRLKFGTVRNGEKTEATASSVGCIFVLRLS